MASSLFKKLNNKLSFQLLLLKKLPLAFVAGLKNDELNESVCRISLKYGYWNQNPFRSIYFAAQAMAAELSTGLLVLCHAHQTGQSISMLVVGTQAEFTKKAVGKIVFSCLDGNIVAANINEAILDGQGHTFQCRSEGKNEQGETVAVFTFTWSIKVKVKV